jgi:hypothetical protein
MMTGKTCGFSSKPGEGALWRADYDAQYFKELLRDETPEQL